MLFLITYYYSLLLNIKDLIIIKLTKKKIIKEKAV